MQYFFGEVLVVIYWLSIKQMRNYKYFQKVFLKCSLFIKHLHFVPKQDTQCGKSKNSLEKYSVKSICCTILYENIVEKKTQIHSQMEKKSWNQLTLWFTNEKINFTNFTEFLSKNGERRIFRQIDLINW